MDISLFLPSTVSNMPLIIVCDTWENIISDTEE